MTGRRAVVTMAVALLVAACAADAPRQGRPTTDVPTVTQPSTGATSPTAGTTSPTSSPTPDDRFAWSISPVDDALAERMAASWRPGCPVPLDDLRYVTVSYWGFDDAPHDGELVVHRDQAPGVVSAFRAIYRARFPIARMVLVDEYGADDDASMAADNTSAFNCRMATGGSSWSEHAYGRAIDINPVENPYVRGSTVLPPSGEPYVDRDRGAPGMIHPGDVLVRAFAAIGWEWGGDWTSLKDYQHFSLTGR